MSEATESVESVESRIQSMEQEIVRLKAVTASENTIAFPISVGIVVIIYISVIASLPLPRNPGSADRLWIGVLSASAGLWILSTALDFVKASLKSIVEIAMCLLALGNALVGALLWTAYGSGDTTSIFQNVADREALAVVAVLIALTLFVADCLAFLVLYPLARTAGTDLEGNSAPDFSDLWKKFRS